MPATEPEHGWTVSLRRKPASGTSEPGDPGNDTYEIICRICGDDPALDDQQIPAELQKIRGPYTLSDGISAFAQHNEFHNGTDSELAGLASGSVSLAADQNDMRHPPIERVTREDNSR